MNFGSAIECLKQGGRVAREGWNDKGMFLFLVTPKTVGDDDWCSLDLPSSAQSAWNLPQRPVIAMKDATDHLVIGWLASGTDILSEDWASV